MAPPAEHRSKLHAAVVTRLLECTPPDADPAAWIAESAGLPLRDVAAFLEGSLPISVDSANAILRACCNEDLAAIATRVTAGTYPVEGD